MAALEAGRPLEQRIGPTLPQVIRGVDCALVFRGRGAGGGNARGRTSDGLFGVCAPCGGDRDSQEDPASQGGGIPQGLNPEACAQLPAGVLPTGNEEASLGGRRDDRQPRETPVPPLCLLQKQEGREACVSAWFLESGAFTQVVTLVSASTHTCSCACAYIL